jgi:hypothetical protein
MPIKPENRALYPANWGEIRAAVLARAGYRCEGSPAYPGCRAANHQRHPVTGSRVVLTVAHWPDHDPRNCDMNNLHAWCQRCHLTVDAADSGKSLGRRMGELRERSRGKTTRKAGSVMLWGTYTPLRGDKRPSDALTHLWEPVKDKPLYTTLCGMSSERAPNLFGDPPRCKICERQAQVRGVVTEGYFTLDMKLEGGEIDAVQHD